MLDASKLLSAASLFALAAALPTNTTDPNADDIACFTSLRDHDISSVSYTGESTTEVTSTRVYYSQVTDRDVPMTTLCDGRARALESFKTYEVTMTETLDPPETNTIYAPYTGVSPTCTIAQTACAAVASAFPDEYPRCELPPPPTTSLACASKPGDCYIGDPRDQKLYYWPVTTVSGDFCAQNGSTVFADPTNPPAPNTVVKDGYTFTSPTNYLSFAHIEAVIHLDRPHVTACGPGGHDNVVVPITESFYSRGYKSGWVSYSFNFADFNTIPADVFNRQRKCQGNPDCRQGIEGQYTPIIPLPTEIVNLEPDWVSAGCKGTGDGYYIQPVALATPAPTSGSKML